MPNNIGSVNIVKILIFHLMIESYDILLCEMGK